jgi:lipopolysaccharide export system protein LptA
VYDEPRFHVTANFLNYFLTDERVVAVGDVHGRMASGSTLVGPIAEYKRITPTHPREEMTARARPTITIVEKDSAGKPVPPTTVVAEVVHMDGDSLIYGSGHVVITRPNTLTPTPNPGGIEATADSVFLDQGKETMRLMRQPMISGKKERPFTLKGDLIDAYSSNKKLQRVIARANAVATSDSMRIKSDTIDLRVKDDLLQHAYAWGKITRAHAESPTQIVDADSLDVTMPAQKVQLIRALARAYAQGKPDTTRFRVEKPDTADWLRGDTITAHFDTLATKDTSKTPPIRQLLALGNASSWYHMAASDTAQRCPAINQVSAKRITIDFDHAPGKQQVATVTAIDSVVGVFIEPRSDTTALACNGGKAIRAAAPKAGPQTAPGKAAPKTTTPATPAKPPVKPPKPNPSLLDSRDGTRR